MVNRNGVKFVEEESRITIIFIFDWRNFKFNRNFISHGNFIIVLVLKIGAVKSYTCGTESNVCFMEKKLEVAKKRKNFGY